MYTSRFLLLLFLKKSYIYLSGNKVEVKGSYIRLSSIQKLLYRNFEKHDPEFTDVLAET